MGVASDIFRRWSYRKLPDHLTLTVLLPPLLQSALSLRYRGLKHFLVGTALYSSACWLAVFFYNGLCLLQRNVSLMRGEMSSCLLFCRVSWALREGFDEDLSSGLGVPRSLTQSAHCLVVGLWICSHLLQEAASLVMTEGSIDLLPWPEAILIFLCIS